MGRARKRVNKYKRGHQLSEAEKGRVVGLCQALGNISEVRRLTRYAKGTIRYLKDRFEASESIARKVGSGRKRKTTSREDRLIAIAVKRDRSSSGNSIRKDLNITHVTERTVRRRIQTDVGFASYCKTKKPFISETNRISRLQWARDHQEWTIEQWRKVLCTDSLPLYWS
jgi:DNA-directed RNA polymerase I, II, and III subunit RPABC1